MTNEDQTRNADDDDSKQRHKNSSLLSRKFYIYICLPHCYNVISQKMIFKKCDNVTHSALSWFTSFDALVHNTVVVLFSFVLGVNVQTCW